jgi:hypothetical protein
MKEKSKRVSRFTSESGLVKAGTLARLKIVPELPPERARLSFSLTQVSLAGFASR